MNNQLEQTLAKVIEQALALAEKTGNFVLDQAPDLIKQFYTWHMVSHIFFLLLGVGIFLLGRYLPYMWSTKERLSYGYRFFGRWIDEDLIVISWAVFIVPSIVSIVMIIHNLYYLIYLIIAPKLYIIDYFIGT